MSSLRGWNHSPTLKPLAASLMWNRKDVYEGRMARWIAMAWSQLSFSPTAFLFATTSHIPQQLQAAKFCSGSHALCSKQSKTVPRDWWSLLKPKALEFFCSGPAKSASVQGRARPSAMGSQRVCPGPSIKCLSCRCKTPCLLSAWPVAMTRCDFSSSSSKQRFQMETTSTGCGC